MVQSISLPGRPPPESTPLRLRTSSRAFRAASRASAASWALAITFLAAAGFVLEELGELVVDDLGDDPLDLAVAQLRLGLALELRVGHADADDRRQAFLEVLAGDREVLVLGRRGGLRVGVQRPRQRRAEPGQVGAPFDRVDVVAVGDDHLADRLVVLQRDLDFNGPLLVLAREHHRRVQRRLRPVQVGDELAQALRREELLVAGLVAPLVGQADRDPLVQERQLAEPLLQHVVVKVDDREDGRRRAGT